MCVGVGVGGIEDNSKIIFLFSQKKTNVVTPH